MTKNIRILAKTINWQLEREAEIEREGNNTSTAQSSLKALVYNLSENLRHDNTKLDVEKFYVACGLTEQDFVNDYIPF